ncbi:hypothetical protein [Cardinium endosymbiont of Tipula unca]|uniref:CIS tube protein n=1 Tax=Cardinium endosymbiont of Tipula unca TaxID=3066216 RepID=UPI0030D4C8D5
MSNVSKLAIKACSDNKFSSFTGEFITSINPENLAIKSGVEYHAAQGMVGPNLLKYRGSPPKLLTFSLLFDNTGIMPGSNTIHVMEQVKQLQDVAYNVNKKNNTPNYIRVIWGQIDFKGRLVDLDITYSMFQVDGTLVRAEASIAILEELPPLGAGKSSLGKESNYAKPSGANATANNRSVGNPALSNEEAFAATPNGMNGAYSGAPHGAYDGGPDRVYPGANSSGRDNSVASSAAPQSSSSSGSNATNSDTSMPPTTSHSGTDASSVGGPSNSSGDAGTFHDKPQGGGGVAGNGPGGSGGGVGGGGHERGSSSSGSGKSSNDTALDNKAGSSEKGSSGNVGGGNTASSEKNSGGTASNNNPASYGSGNGSNVPGSSSSAKSKSAGLKDAKSSSGSNSLRKIKDSSFDVAANLSIPTMSPWQRLKMLAKKVGSKAYNAGKKLVS